MTKKDYIEKYGEEAYQKKLEYLIDWGIYYNRPANELIFLTNSEHRKLHNRAKR